jgi:hypothetical protein
MSDETQLKERFTDYLADEPAMQLQVGDVVLRGRRDARRRAGIGAGGVVAAVALTLAGTSWYVDRADQGAPPEPAQPPTTSASAEPGPGHTPPQEMASTLRRVVADYYGSGTTDVRLWAATWSDFAAPDPVDDVALQQPALPAGEEARATEWHYWLRPSPASLVSVDVRYLPPDLPDGYVSQSCLPDEVRYDNCTEGVLADGTTWKQTFQVHGGEPGSDPTSIRTLTTVRGDLQVTLIETHRADWSADPVGGDWLVSTDEAMDLATEQGLTFEAPAVDPPLPSYEFCDWSGGPDCLD